MKIFFINTSKSWGGGEKWHFDTAFSLKNNGQDIAIFTGRGNKLYQRSVSAGIKTIKVKISNLSFLNPFSINRMKRIFKSEHPDIVILNLSSDLKTAGVAARLAGVEHIIYRRGNARPIRNSIVNRILFRKIITDVIVNSEHTKRAVLKNNRLLFPGPKIKVLYNGIDLRAYDIQKYEPIHHNRPGQITIGSAGRLSNEKGHHFLIELAVRLRQKQIPFLIIIAGEGPAKESLIKNCKDERLDEVIRFIGFQENIKSLMESIDIFILPSLWEGFGYVSIEAMASKKPVIAFRTGSNPEIIVDAETGFLVDCFDINEMSERVRLLAKDPGLRLALGRAGRERVEKMFNSEITDVAIFNYLTDLYTK